MRIFLVVFCLLWALCGAIFLQQPSQILLQQRARPAGVASENATHLPEAPPSNAHH